ncbi:MAG TPA: AbrB/MazE/SpoVT family DNA-binding domain-containing protein [Candidatus Saccharimonadales bacterium]|jgi:AbrB family looped-hinge helix DNA binding protein|nr:AbrB/MazE/SpoVT family DNA-binding domain-containing protein [Candidatus Saccharimonadales bacterium]
MFPKFAGAVTVGERGQIVIPAEVRAQLLIGPGDKVLVFTRGDGKDILITKAESFEQRAEAMYNHFMPLIKEVKKVTKINNIIDKKQKSA